ncbi:putative transcriptional regulatory protein [Vanrija pseudolonga]|uniref:Transcriptional regulatory protein n=1 Tax=Vanrija pseudolonga TaxID=143232 RepID=A0AAF0Y035_9TREE|nr:putative transcriptional regulatory protein [Vanrija pseudolonga]
MSGPSTRACLRALASAASGTSAAGTSRLPLPRPAFARALATSAPAASGHNRWSKIRHRKGAADAARGQHWSRLMTAVHMALRPPASHDPGQNPRLAFALQRAKDGGVPKANVEQAFERARKALDGTGQSIVYEAIGPGGQSAFMVECLTDSPARTVSRVKEILHKNGGRVSAVSFLFERKGLVRVQPLPGASFDALFETAVEGGAEDVREAEVDEEGKDEPVWEVRTAPTDLGALTDLLTSPPHDASYALVSSELAFLPLDPLPVDETDDHFEAAARIAQLLEDDADVVKVWTNIE